MNLFSVKEKVVIITGAARGNGRAIADGFVAHGAVVYYVDILDPSETAPLKGDHNAYYIKANVCHQSDIDRILAIVVEKSGCVDVLVNNAGISLSPYDGDPDVVWDKTIDVNLKGAFLFSTAVARIMKENKSGSIINITSLGAELAFPGNPSYVASKGGLKQLSKALAYDLAPYGVRVNTICPGYFRTSMTQKSYNNPEMKKARDSRILLGRWGEPSDLIGPCIFLASNASAYITGADLVVDGGWLAKGL